MPGPEASRATTVWTGTALARVKRQAARAANSRTSTTAAPSQMREAGAGRSLRSMRKSSNVGLGGLISSLPSAQRKAISGFRVNFFAPPFEKAFDAKARS